jgi:processive 1,2-diacylglycerol beta-glucosyltransferase
MQGREEVRVGGRIAICTAAVGCGHSTAAKAIAQALGHADAGVQVDVIEALDLAPRWFTKVYRDGYLRLISNTPRLAGKLYDGTDAYVTRRGIGHAVENHVMRGLVAHPVIQNADVIMTTHFLCGRVLSWAKRDGAVRAPLVVAVTDQHPHGVWLTPGAELTMVASDEARAVAIERGVAAERLGVAGIPINPRFSGSLNQQEARRSLQMPLDRPMILISGGGLGLGTMADVARAILASSVRAHVVVVCGRNEALMRELGDLARTRRDGAVSMQVLGYTTQMPELMSAADVLIGKPGGLTTAEACAVGLPLVLVDPIPGQEERNAERLERLGAAVLCRDAQVAAEEARALVQDGGRLQRMRAAAKSLGVANAAEMVARVGLKLLAETPRVRTRDEVLERTAERRGVTALDAEPCPAC